MLSPDPRTSQSQPFPAAEDLARFVSSMPAAYRLEHDADEAQAHAEIVARRREAIAHVEAVSYRARLGRWLCVVTDDRPGLLSLLSAAISANGLDIQNAKVYCRERPRLPDEAVDFFCVRRIREPFDLELSVQHLTSIRNSIESLLVGELDAASLERRRTLGARPREHASSAVFFQETADADLLIVRTADHPGLLLRITLTLFREGLTIQRSNVATLGDLASDEFELSELDGSPLTEARKANIVRTVLSMLSQAAG